jgi:hypothetical protein
MADAETVTACGLRCSMLQDYQLSNVRSDPRYLR